MKRMVIILLSLFVSGGLTVQAQKNTCGLPAFMTGHFTDDYNIRYHITDTLWTQLPNIKYHIISCDTAAQYLLALNDALNRTEPGLYTRIDYMHFNNMAPFYWGFCLTTYNAATPEEARTRAVADRENPRKGCNGYPFSRMKRVEE